MRHFRINQIDINSRDVSDTEGGVPIPQEIEAPFERRHGEVAKQLDRILENCKRDGIRVHWVSHGSQMAGKIQLTQSVAAGNFVTFRKRAIRVNYELLVNENLSREARYVTIVYELGHLYCVHLGTSNSK